MKKIEARDSPVGCLRKSAQRWSDTESKTGGGKERRVRAAKVKRLA